MKMDGAFAITMVHEANNGFNTLGDNDGRPGTGAIVSNKASWGFPRVDLLCVRLDIKLVVPHLLIGHWIDDFSIRILALKIPKILEWPTYCFT
jgi:hypothetical protein